MPKHLEPSQPCACHSGLAYGDCCRPFHRGEREPQTPTALMRSRFSAFALENAEYLARTLHARHADKGRPRDEVLRALRRASKTYDYEGLDILDADATRVLFRARLRERGQDRSFVERSLFEHDGTGWRYVSGEVRSAADVPDGVTLATFEPAPG